MAPLMPLMRWIFNWSSDAVMHPIEIRRLTFSKYTIHMKMDVIKIAVVALVALTGSTAFAAGIDIVQAPTGFFVPTDAQKFDFPYYRSFGQDWGWTHGALNTSGAVSADLHISAFDVDFDGTPSGENDLIQAWDSDSASWITLGLLGGGNDIWAYSDFSLNLSTFGNEINSGLSVRILIDVTTQGDWSVTLGKSVLTVDQTKGIPPPEPSVPDSTSTLMLSASGLALLALLRRKLA
jgi:hypothetical protein